MKFQGYTRFQLKLGGLAVDDINRFIACRNVLEKDDVLVGDANTGKFSQNTSILFELKFNRFSNIF